MDLWDKKFDEEEDYVDTRDRKGLASRKFSLDFLSKLQKQTIVAVAILLVVLSAKYSGDTTSNAVISAFRTALSPKNDYSMALTDMAKSYLGGREGMVTAAKGGGAANAPLKGSVVSGFGWQTSPLDQEKRYNTGIYLGAPLGSSVRAPMSGTVSKMGNDPVLGRYLKIDHGAGLSSLIANLGEVKVKALQKVNKGEDIGTLGFSAAMKRPWLYWEVRRNDQPIDPASLMGSGAPSKI